MSHVYERADGSPKVQTNPPLIQREYVCYPFDNEADVITAVRNATQLTDMLNGAVLTRKIRGAHPEGKGGSVWIASVDWVYKTIPLQFSVTGESTKRIVSYRTNGKFPCPGTSQAPDFKGGIGYDGNDFQGCDVQAPVFQWTETHRFPISAVSFNYVKAVGGLVSTPLNSSPFRTFDRGEVKFMGMSGGTKYDDTEVEFQYTFQASQHANSIQVAGATVNKQGWDYLWIFSEEREDEAKKYRIKVPIAVYCEQVFQYGSYGVLNI